VQAYKNTLQKTAYRTLGRLILEHAERVVFISQRVRNWFEKRMHFLHEAAFIPNGVDRGIFYPPTAAERETSRVRLGFSPDDFVLLFVGRFTEKKGLHLVREIAQARPHLRWLMIGSGQIDPRAWDLSNVTVLSPQSQAGLREFYLAADLFALPSVGEGFPLAVQEALSCGLPVAVSEEIANHLPDAPLVRLDIAALPILLETLDGLFATREQLSNLGRAAAEYAKRWDWAGVARQYEGLFIELTTSH
jgi:glycosyltransferase involved in cell wall biosynthesis